MFAASERGNRGNCVLHLLRRRARIPGPPDTAAQVKSGITWRSKPIASKMAGADRAVDVGAVCAGDAELDSRRPFRVGLAEKRFRCPAARGLQ